MGNGPEKKRKTQTGQNERFPQRIVARNAKGRTGVCVCVPKWKCAA